MAVGIYAGRLETESHSIALAQDVPECAEMVQMTARPIC